MGAQNINNRQCVIVSAGEILDYRKAAEEILPGAFILCADGGYGHCGQLGVHPDLLMGDFDSITEPLPLEVPVIALPQEKNYTDTTLAIAKARELGFTNLLLLGMLGGRLDHALANLQELCGCARRGLQARITDGRTSVYALAALQNPASITVAPLNRHYFSLLAMSGICEGVTIRGGAYPLEEYTLLGDTPRAVSNEFKGEPVNIFLKQGVLLVVVTPM